MQAIKTMQRELTKIQQAQDECVNEFGIVKSSMRYRYGMLVQKAREFKESIQWLQDQIINKK